MAQPTLTQASFRGRDDDVGLNSSTFNGGGGLNTNWTQSVSTPFRVRFLIQETGSGSSNDTQFKLYYSHNSGTYREMGQGTNTLVQCTLSTQYTNGATTSQVLGAGTYIAGESLGGVETEGNNSTGNIDIETSKEFELEWCLAVDGAAVSDGDTFDFRVRRGSTLLDVYTNTPQITCDVPPLPDVIGGLGDSAFFQSSWQNLYTTAGWSSANQYFMQGNIETHPSTIQPYHVRLTGNSLRAKALGVTAPGLFPAGANDTISKSVSLATGRYVLEYWQVEHDDGDWTITIKSNGTTVKTISGVEAVGETTWQGPFAHPFYHSTGNVTIEFYYKAPDVPTDNNTGIKVTGLRIREQAGIDSFTLTASAAATTPMAGTLVMRDFANDQVKLSEVIT